MRLQIFLGNIIIVILHLPLFIFGENSIIFGHDNVDFDIIQKHILKLTNQFFSFNIIRKSIHIYPFIFLIF